MNVGKLTCSYKITGTKNFRLSAAKLFGSIGTNLQNPAETLMRCIHPAKGNKFTQPDQSGAEALVVAMECRPGRFRKLFDLGIKAHSYTALQIFTNKFRGTFPASRYLNVEPEVLITYPEFKELFKTIKESKREYDLGKGVRHAKNYRMGPRTFQLKALLDSAGEIRLSFKEAKEFLGIDDATFPEILEWQQITIDKAKRDRVVRNLFGHPRQLNLIWSEAYERDIIAFLPQSTVGVITHMAYTELWHRIRKEHLPWKLLNNKHDSLLIEHPDTAEHSEMSIAYCKQHMGRELVSSRGEHYQMKVGISQGYNWGHHDPKTNPQGMVEL